MLSSRQFGRLRLSGGFERKMPVMSSQIVQILSLRGEACLNFVFLIDHELNRHKSTLSLATSDVLPPRCSQALRPCDQRASTRRTECELFSERDLTCTRSATLPVRSIKPDHGNIESIRAGVLVDQFPRWFFDKLFVQA